LSPVDPEVHIINKPQEGTVQTVISTVGSTLRMLDPHLLGLVLLVLSMTGMFVWTIHEDRLLAHERSKLLIDACFQIGRALQSHGDLPMPPQQEPPRLRIN
jgi:hypothetical protein